MFLVSRTISQLASASSEPLTEPGLPTRSQPKQKRSKSVVDMASPIAADGGFGQMESDASESDEDVAAKLPEHTPEREKIEDVGDLEDLEDDMGDDFDDFEAGAAHEDFGDFDEDEEAEPVGPAAPSIQSLPALESPFVSSLPLFMVTWCLSCERLSSVTER